MDITFHPYLQPPFETLVIPVPLNPQLQEVLEAVGKSAGVPAATLERDFKAEHGEIHPVYTGSGRIYLLGLGEKPLFAEVLKAFRSFSFKFRKKLTSSIGVSFLFQNAPTDPARWVEAALNGLVLGTYQIGRFKTNGVERHPLDDPSARIQFFLDPLQAEKARQVVDVALAIARTQLGLLDLVNAPSNKKLPYDLGEWAKRSGEQYGYQVAVFDKARIEKEGLFALLAVNQGSAHPAAFIVMEYRPPAEGPFKKIGLVGKGVTFDTGGLSLKPSANMHLMKSDMGGAAAVLGAVEAAARLQLPVHLIGIIPATDNAVDAASLKPSDVIASYSGKTIEVIDTDAEGRLILADGLSYLVRNYAPDILIDLATLTGSTVRTFGYHAGGLFSNNDQLAEELFQAGMESGERVWRLPIWDVYKEDIKSDIADVRNFSGKPTAGAIAAAKFLEVFTLGHPAWAHLDIAGMAFSDTEFTSQKSATAYGVRLLTEFFRKVAG